MKYFLSVLTLSVLLSQYIYGQIFDLSSMSKANTVSNTVVTPLTRAKIVEHILGKCVLTDQEKVIVDKNNDKEINIADVVNFTNDLYVAELTESVNGHDYVDMGFKDGAGNTILWATCNIGAETPSDYGGLYAWGELETKTSYTAANYKYGYPDYNKYNNQDNYIRLRLEDDVAAQSWGGGWRMPLTKEIEQLMDNCTFEWTTINNHKGCTFISKINGNRIFLPAAGYSDVNSGSVVSKGIAGVYWGEEINDHTYGHMYSFTTAEKKFYTNPNGTRYQGRSVRAVCIVKTPSSISIPIFNGEGDEEADPDLDVLAPKREAAGGFEK